MKVCNTCHQSKDFGQFYKRSDSYKDPYRSDCKECLALKAAKRYENDPIKFNLQSKRWRDQNPEAEKNRSKRYREENKESCSHRSTQWQKANPEKRKEIIKRHRVKQPDKYREMSGRTRIAKADARPKWLTKKQRAEITQFYKLAIALSELTSIDYHVDHIIPLKGKIVCGLHVPWNLRVIPASDNHKKSNKLTDL